MSSVAVSSSVYTCATVDALAGADQVPAYDDAEVPGIGTTHSPPRSSPIVIITWVTPWSSTALAPRSTGPPADVNERGATVTSDTYGSWSNGADPACCTEPMNSVVASSSSSTAVTSI